MKFSPKAVMSGVGVYFAAAVGGYLYLRSTKAPAPSPRGCGGRHTVSGGGGSGKGGDSSEVADGGGTFDRLADGYDRINMDEGVMGIRLMRRWLMRQAEGDVLEVCAGTGRNLKYYNLGRLRSLTLTDNSRPMLVNAADKFQAMGPPAADAPPVRFELADVQHLVAGPGSSSSSTSEAGSSGAEASSGSGNVGATSGGTGPAAAAGPTAAAGAQSTTAAAPAAAGTGAPQRPPIRQLQTFQPHSFDVVVDTYGLCSLQDPVTALKEMARVCKPGGRILLLEHGKGSWKFFNNLLDGGAGEHFRKWGCWWNRDIEQMVRQAGLEIETVSRWHFGTTCMVVARPSTTAVAPAA